MKHRKSASRLLLVGILLWIPDVATDAQTPHDIGATREDLLFLTLKDNGQHLAASVGQQIQITLGAHAACPPKISSPAVRFESVALKWPPTPGIATYFYSFAAAAEGEAQVRIPISDCLNPDSPQGLTFAITVRVEPASGRPSAPLPSRNLDQANTSAWKDAWTNLVSEPEQTFTPTLPKLTGVEVELVVANPGPASGDIEMTLRNEAGDVLAQVSRTVPVADCSHVLFVLPNGGLPLSPGQVYRIRLSGNSLFGWKYNDGGYQNGQAWFNRKLFRPEKRSSFLFRTFGPAEPQPQSDCDAPSKL
jgi:hypothetical protein